MAVESPEDTERFGRQVAGSFPGFNPSAPGFDAYRYGRIARYSMGKGRGVPDPREFTGAGAEEEAAAPAAPEAGRRVRIGRIEMRLSEEAPARHRPQHVKHRGQRSSGRYRFRLTRRSGRPRYRSR